jgi:hypothetical protein
MELITLEQITELQSEYGLTDLQRFIDTGDAWLTEGHIGRTAMSALEQGACLLPEESHIDAYGNRVPSRTDLMPGTKGTLTNAQNFWENVLSGEIELDKP